VLEPLRPLAHRSAIVRTALRTDERFSEVRGGQLASAITLTAFLSLFPLLLVAIAVVGFFSAGSQTLPNDVVRHLGLTGQAADIVRQALRTAARSRKVASIIGLAGLLWSGLALVGALEQAFDAVWQVPGRGWRDKLVGLGWLAGASLIFALSFGVTAVLNYLPAALAPVGIVVGLAIDVGLWLWTLVVLPNRPVGWRAVLPGAVFGAIGLEILKAVGSFYIPHAVASSSQLYGSLGVVFAILAWLAFFGRLVVYAAALNVTLWEQRHGTVSVRTEVPSLGGRKPSRATRSGEARAS
jgi:membrane protein